MSALSDPTVRLIGRGLEARDVRRLTVARRLVTLTGPGGVGKTTLARMIATDPPSELERCSFVRLSRIRDSSLVATAVADSMGLRATEGMRPIDLIVERVGSHPDLLILDNLEHLPEAAATVLELLDRCPQLRVLATSRAPLRISQEWVYDVPALQTPSSAGEGTSPEMVDAVALFLERAHATGSLPDPTPEDLESIADICDRLEGLPLAIELAASRVQHMPVGSIRAHLDDAMTLLGGGPVDAHERHQALERTVGWSYDLLERHVAVVFGRLGVFVGSFGPAAVRAVASDLSPSSELEVINTLSLLVDQSLLRQAPAFEGQPRYSLHEVIRQFALSVVDDEDLARRRHLAYYVDLAEDAELGLSRAEQASWAGLVSRELPNLRAALACGVSSGDRERLLRLAAALGDFWRRNGDPREGLDWLERASSDDETGDALLKARARYQAARILFDLGDRDRALIRLESAMRFADASGDIVMKARTRAGLGVFRLATGQADRAATAIDEAVAIARRVGESGLLAEVLAAEAYFRGSLGQLDAATALSTEYVELERLNGNKRALANGLLNLANERLHRSEHGDAARLIEEAIGAMAGFEVDNNLPFAHLMLGVVRSRLGNPGAARASIAVGAAEALRRPVVQDHVLAAEAIAEWLGADSSHEEALQLWGAAEQARTTHNIPYELVDEGWLKGGIVRDRASVPERVAEERWKSGQATELDAAIEIGLAAMRVTGDTGRRRPTAAQTMPEELTKRELEVLGLLSEGKSDPDIAEALFISPKTASVHVANIKGKLGASSRVNIVTTAMRLGLIEPPAVG